MSKHLRKAQGATVAGSTALVIDNMLRALLQDEHSIPWLFVVHKGPRLPGLEAVRALWRNQFGLRLVCPVALRLAERGEDGQEYSFGRDRQWFHQRSGLLKRRLLLWSECGCKWRSSGVQCCSIPAGQY
jgi:hypothetical protein